ncbi:MAG: PD-(D/E)XK nuclease family protein [Oscillospiraceae bacterium]|jgi:ATP-dependent helicase/nuclease subunit B|nr:PD-(D/E)XK nuclease family protein [Oscillospiraceae bacterium]
MITVIYGLPGTGKTSCIAERIRELSARGEKSLLFVPEQTLSDTERLFYHLLPRDCLRFVTLTSFTKKAKEIAENFCRLKPYAPQTVKLTLVAEILARHGKNIALADKTLALFEEFAREAFTPETLSALDEGGSLTQKLRSLFTLYDEYGAVLAENYSDMNGNVAKAADLLAEGTAEIEESVFFDGFDGFSGEQLRFVQSLVKSGDNVTITLPFDRSRPDLECAAFAVKSAMKLSAFSPCKFVNAAVETKASPRVPKEFCAFSAPDVYAECEFVAAYIKRLAQNGASYKDIAIINEGASRPLESALSRQNVPYFTDKSTPLTDKPIVKFIITCLEAATLRPEKVAAFLQSGFARVKIEKQPRLLPKTICFSVKPHAETVLLLKNGGFHNRNGYNLFNRKNTGKFADVVKKYGITAKEMRYPFDYRVKHETDQTIVKSLYMRFGDLYAAERVRKHAVRLLTNLRDCVDGKTGAEACEALCRFVFDDMNVKKGVFSIISARGGKFGRGFNADKEKNAAYKKIWELTVEALESVHEAVKSKTVTLDGFTELVKYALSRTMSAKPPQVIDAVTIGDLRRSHFSAIKTLIIVGATRGNFPGANNSGGNFFSPREREKLAKFGAEIFDDAAARHMRESFVIYKAVTTPSERLVITFAESDEMYRETLPAPSLKFDGENISVDLGVKKAKTKVVKTENFDDNFFALTEKSAEFINSANGYGDFYKPSDEIQAIDAKRLLTPPRGFSPSAIDSINNCLFAYFAERGLKITPPENENKSALSPVDRGNIVHLCLENLAHENGDDDAEKAQRIIREYAATNLRNGFDENSRECRAALALLPHISVLLQEVREELCENKFNIAAEEKRLAFDFGGVRVGGKADRIDVKNDEVRIIDYKTGAEKFGRNSDDRILAGLDWQLLLYLFGWSESHAASKAAVCYQSCGSSLADVHAEETLTLSETETAAIRAENFKLTQYPQKGALSADETKTLKRVLEGKLAARLAQMFAGNVSAKPVTLGEKEVSCEWCGYKGACENVRRKF